MHKRALTIAITADFDSMTLDDIHISPFFNSKVFFRKYCVNTTHLVLARYYSITNKRDKCSTVVMLICIRHNKVVHK